MICGTAAKFRRISPFRVECAGKPLITGQEVFWKVQAWDRRGKPLRLRCLVARWSMGLLNESDWRAQWIGCERNARIQTAEAPAVGYLRPDDNPEILATPEISAEGISRLNQPVRRAMIYVTALGVYELRLNGRRVGDHILAPEWTAYDKRVPVSPGLRCQQAACSARAPMRLPPRSATAGIAASGNTGLTRCGFMAINRC